MEGICHEPVLGDQVDRRHQLIVGRHRVLGKRLGSLQRLDDFVMVEALSKDNWEGPMQTDAMMARGYSDDILSDTVDAHSDVVRLKKKNGQDLKASKQPCATSKAPCDRSMSLHVSKLRGISFDVRAKLKRNGVTYTHQLLEAAGQPRQRHEFSEISGIEESTLARLTCRADLARIKGIGAIFADMLELLSVDRVVTLAGQEADVLHNALATLNSAERFARRAPTPEEVEDWVMQARELPKLVAAEA